MSWLKQLPLLSLSLVLLSYSVVGWLIASISKSGTTWILENSYYYWGLSLSAITVTRFIWLLGVLGAMLMILLVVSPWPVVKIFFWSWLQSDTRAIASILAWAFAAVLIVCNLQLFVRILVVLSAEILACLDLQTANYNRWQILILLSFVSLSGFILGLLLFNV